ncbi:MAG: NAD-dependent epimerase/dehydratase family protein [Chloroflexi bacterium OHK40]
MTNRDFKGQLVLITGARGFIGRYLARFLATRGAQVVGLGHGAWPQEQAQHWGVTTWINGDIVPANLDMLARNVGFPQVIFHLAGGSSVGFSLLAPEEDYRRSVESTLQLLEWMRSHAPAVRIVLASSAAVYGDGHCRPITEDAALAPYSPYGYHKRIAELLVDSYRLSFGLSTATVRLFSIYGPLLRKQLLWDLCARLQVAPKVLHLDGSGEESRDWLHVEDAAAWLAMAADHASPTGFVLNGGTGIATRVRAVADQVCRAWGLAPELRFSGHSRPGDPAYLVADPGVSQGLNLTPTIDWRTGIQQYVDWFRQTLGDRATLSD